MSEDRDRFPKNDELGEENDVVGFALGFILDFARNYLQGKTQVEALMFSLFRHCAIEFIE